MDMLQRALMVSRHVKDVVIDGQAVLMDLRTGMYFGLDEVGTAIWQLIPDASNGAAIVERLAPDYDVTLAVLAADVDRFLCDLKQRELIALRES